MSTHFRPLPPRSPPPPSPTRPSTAHSTIRAVTPSPQSSVNQASQPKFPLPRRKSDHALGSAELATYARYVVRAEESGFGEPPIGAGEFATGLKRGGVSAGRMSPGKRVSGSSSPRKREGRREMQRPYSTPEGLGMYAPSPAKEEDGMTEQQGREQVGDAKTQNQVAEGISYFDDEDDEDDDEDEDEDEDDDDDDEEDEEEEKCPDTPTHTTREQKRRAYIPLGAHIRPSPTTSTPPPQQQNRHPPHPTLPILRKPIPYNPAQHHDRISVSAQSKASALSATSKHSIFSTPGRDELERKKALVEVDEGPFARVQSVMDLAEERRRISSGGHVARGADRKGLGIKCGCVVM